MIDIENVDCLVVGGGKIAYRKVMDLLQFNAKVTVIAPEVCNEITILSDITILRKEYEPNDIAGRFLVIAATDSESLNRKIADECKLHKILVNAVDIKDACSFIFPAIIKRDNLVVSISTGGNSPAGAAYLKQKISKSIPDYYEKNMEFLGSVRDEITQKITDGLQRKKLYYDLLEEADQNKKILEKRDIYKHIKKFE
jgi:siroheme synthase-like protein